MYQDLRLQSQCRLERVGYGNPPPKGNTLTPAERQSHDLEDHTVKHGEPIYLHTTFSKSARLAALAENHRCDDKFLLRQRCIPQQDCVRAACLTAEIGPISYQFMPTNCNCASYTGYLYVPYVCIVVQYDDILYITVHVRYVHVVLYVPEGSRTGALTKLYRTVP